MAKGKPHMNVVFVGHVDAGKSTTVGRLLFDTGSIDDAAIRKLKEKAEELGKGGFEFAFVMDNLKEERERGVTIDLAHKQFSTDKFDWTIIDAPGHRDFIKNMITGASQADAAVLVVSNTGVEAQTKEHVFLCKTLGVGQLIVAINKMDVDNYDEAKFNKIKDDVVNLIKMYGFNPDEVKFVPVASYPGDNVAKPSDKLSWFKDGTLLDALNALKEPEKPTELPLRLPIQDVYKIAGIGTVPVGRVETGVMKVGQKIIVMPARSGKGAAGEVKSIEMHHEQYQEAGPGDNVGFNVRGIESKDIARGDVLADAGSPAKVATEFTAQIVVMNHPSVITVGYTPVFHIHTAQVACQVTEIKKKINPASGEEIGENPDFIKNGEAAIVQMKPVQALCIEKQADIPQLSRFAIRDSGLTVAAGMCIDLVEKK
ncbi:MAG: translation elongation factor EF-1 subunit alpha [Candidatus Woesearchaeota archaeon]|jgi:elongation factor 1-alpha|nr:translation elongation factor EF-1 subunit alpha [Candidatus Woesearchaeota archaeon]MDP7181155.1 translation elongation factor EF-1 subunit alpha [Candidatus Woesearchaeota archaeon]MDP7198224.1 translation elongation factor EF-1 subunit alpha [Candidatus Woesearchaeota archaeon]MDP7467060.1 translation elongation factor EF-1 subunit alpha [Candidatus Woesearchaeota archaeon]MDP7646728.1 translation elongation factor EF-1 subunit alpha [Candidatus Woesearchaeota archaeon]